MKYEYNGNLNIEDRIVNVCNDIKECYPNIPIDKLKKIAALETPIIDNIVNNTISSKQAKEIFNKSLLEKKSPLEFINNYKQISNKEELTNIIKNIISNNREQKELYLNGRSNLFDYFVGQVMKETKGKANPTITKEILLEELNK